MNLTTFVQTQDRRFPQLPRTQGPNPFMGKVVQKFAALPETFTRLEMKGVRFPRIVTSTPVQFRDPYTNVELQWDDWFCVQKEINIDHVIPTNAVLHNRAIGPLVYSDLHNMVPVLTVTNKMRDSIGYDDVSTENMNLRLIVDEPHKQLGLVFTPSNFTPSAVLQTKLKMHEEDQYPEDYSSRLQKIGYSLISIDSPYNSSYSNLPGSDISARHSTCFTKAHMECKLTPAVGSRGILARKVLYCYAMYSQLEVEFTAVARLDVMIRWHLQEPVDAYELLLNLHAWVITGAWNMFIGGIIITEDGQLQYRVAPPETVNLLLNTAETSTFLQSLQEAKDITSGMGHDLNSEWIEPYLTSREASYCGQLRRRLKGGGILRKRTKTPKKLNKRSHNKH